MANRLTGKLKYYGRVFPAYFGKKQSQLNFWHETPAANTSCPYTSIGAYYMTFEDKAGYEGPFDKDGVPLLDYRGHIGRQYNPIAIAQYGLANFNLFLRTKESLYLNKARTQADWLVSNLEKNEKDVLVWNHHFNWEYRKMLHAPWYSGLSQGNGISLLARIYQQTEDDKYRKAAEDAFISLTIPIEEGGVIYIDKDANPWIEEVIITPPTHILNGFLWALWGVWDYYLLKKDKEVKERFDSLINTLKANIHRFDAGYWSLYELSDLHLKMLASPFYHSLHCVQLRITAKMSAEEIFLDYAEKWESYAKRMLDRYRALAGKALFKLIYY